MVLSIPLSTEVEAQLRAKAAAAGVDLQTFAARALEQFASRPTLDEVLLPLRAEIERSGLDEDELTSLLERAKHELRAERRPSPKR